MKPYRLPKGASCFGHSAAHLRRRAGGDAPKGSSSRAPARNVDNSGTGWNERGRSMEYTPSIHPFSFILSFGRCGSVRNGHRDRSSMLGVAVERI